MRRLLSLFCLTVSGILTLSAQEEIYHFAEDHPLVRGSIQAIAIDSAGYLWIGGQSSLRRFDGEEVENFGNRREDTTDLSGDYIEVLFVSKEGVLWVGQQHGLSRFHYNNETFSNYQPPIGSARITGIITANDDYLWVTSTDALHLFDPKSGQFIASHHWPANKKEVAPIGIRSLMPISHKDVLLTAGNGLFRFHKNRIIKLAFPFPPDALPLGAIAKTTDGNFLVGSQNGLWTLAEKEDSIVLKHHHQLGDLGSNENKVSSVLIDAHQQYWCGTESGLYRIINGDSITTTYYGFTEGNDDGLSAPGIRAISRSKDGVLLVGTERGLDRIDLNPPPFPVLRPSSTNGGLCHRVTKGMAYDDSSNQLLVGTQDGLAIVNVNTLQSNCFQPENLDGLRTGYLFNVEPGPELGTYWLCYRNEGINLLDLSNPDQIAVRDLNFGENDPGGGGVYEVAIDKDGKHWIATSKGVLIYDPNGGTTNRIVAESESSDGLSTNNVLCITADRKNRIWFGTLRGGLCVREIIDGVETVNCFRYREDDPTSLPSDIILSIAEDQQGYIWVSTPDGLCRYLENGIFQTYGKEQGIDYVFNYGTFLDASTQLWTLYGGNLCALEFVDSDQINITREITRISGLTSMPNTQHGWEALPDGRIAISGRNGLSIINPSVQSVTKQYPEIILTDFFLFNRAISGASNVTRDAFQENFSLPDDINNLERVVLPPGQNYPGLRFAALDLRRYHTTYYSWRLPGLQDDWVDLERERTVSFPFLKPGLHTLEVRTGDAGGNWSTQVRTLELEVIAPWYERSWARLLWLVILSTVVYLFFWSREQRFRKIKAARLAEREELRRRSARDFHDESGGYLSRIALLTSLLKNEAVKNQLDTTHSRLIQEVEQNVQKLREGMRDFIWALDPDQDNTFELALRLKRYGQELFAHHPGRLLTTFKEEELAKISLSTVQRRNLLLFLKEAMHNSFRHAPEASVFHLKIIKQGQKLIVNWSDNGPGYESSQRNTGMGQKSMLQRAEKLGATLEIQSQSGVSIELSLPI